MNTDMATATTSIFDSIADDLAAAQRIFDRELQSHRSCVNSLANQLRSYYGKRLRPALLFLSAKTIAEPTEAHHILAAVVEMVHLATLVHDDVLDEAELRRHAPTISYLQGNEAAVLLGDYLISHAYHLCSSLQDQQASRTIAGVTNTVCEGELLQLSHRGDLELNESTYFQIVGDKTASLCAVCCQLGGVFAGGTDAQVAALHQFGMNLGVAFQIVDDLLDLTGKPEKVGKSLGLDAKKAKLTLPLIRYLLQSPPKQCARMRELISGDAGTEALQEMRKMLRTSPALESTRKTAAERVESAVDQLNSLPETPARDVLAHVARFVVERQS